MNLRKMRSQYRSRCKRCGGRISIGSLIYWSKQTGALCLSCGAKEQNPTPNDQKPQTPTGNAAIVSKLGDREKFSIDWLEMKTFAQEILETNKIPSSVKREVNRRTLDGILGEKFPESFTGYSRGQLQRWMKEGYDTESIRSLQQFTPPIREKRRLQFVDEGDEFHLDLAHNGDDNFMSQWTKREVIPGARVDFIVDFMGNVEAEVVNSFNRWACQVIYSLEAAGIDCEVNYVIIGTPSGCWSNGDIPRKHYSQIRVKKEGEIADFVGISPMLSPAAYRTFSFAATVLHGESIGCSVSGGISGAAGRDIWEVSFDSERRIIQVETPSFNATSFPERLMTEKFVAVLKEMKGN